MKDISSLRKNIFSKYSKKYCNISNGECPNSHCTCLVASEIRAYMETIIPSPYYNFSIKDFTGVSDKGDRLIDDSIVQDAKNKIVKYCWNVNLQKFNDNIESFMDRRREEGRNIVIYSSNDVWGKNGPSVKQKGRTFVASIIMKEAIKRRIDPKNINQQYDWIQYSSLKSGLASDNHDIENSRYSDWLVIDDIIREEDSSRKQRSYINSIMDVFFNERIESRLPTILVFRFDISKCGHVLEDEFGVCMSKIISSQDTLKISLSK